MNMSTGLNPKCQRKTAGASTPLNPKVQNSSHARCVATSATSLERFRGAESGRMGGLRLRGPWLLMAHGQCAYTACVQHAQRQTETRTDRQTDGQTDRQAGRQTNRQTETGTDVGVITIDIDTYMYTNALSTIQFMYSVTVYLYLLLHL